MVFANRDSKSSLLGTLLGTGRGDSTQRALEDSSLDILANGENIQPSFDLHIRSLQFSSFEDFKSRLPDFYSLNNVKYKVVRCTPLTADSLQKSTLIYRYMKYVCCFSDCPSYFVLSKKQNYLRISQFNMNHSHSLLPENYSVMADLSEEFSRYFSQREFESYSDAMKVLHNFEEATGLSFVTGNSQKFKEDDPKSSKLVYKRLLLVCVLYASRYRKTVKTGFPRFSKFTVGCRASITFVSNKDVIKILAFNMKHNHVCGSDLKMLCKRRARTEIPLLGRLENAFREKSSAHCLSTQSTFETESVAPSVGENNLLIFSNAQMHSFDELCSSIKRFSEVTGSEFVYSHGLRLPASDTTWMRILFKTIVFVCVRAGSDSITCKTRSVRTNCPCRIGFRYDGKGFALWHFNVVHNHETIGDLIGHWTTTVGDYDRRFEYVSTLLNLKIPCQIIQICVKRRFGLSMCLADIRRMQRKRRCICESSEVECDEYDASSHPSGLETYVDYDCPFGCCDWAETNCSSRNTKRRKSMRSILVHSEGCRKQRRPFGSRHKNMQISVRERTAKPHEQTRRR
ncbi:hypothetical protein TSMEX_006426 [Taenia solium]|eukprot:TsM_000333500 transcript=TsM_000333500 gene=TsM_000333500